MVVVIKIYNEHGGDKIYNEHGGGDGGDKYTLNVLDGDDEIYNEYVGGDGGHRIYKEYAGGGGDQIYNEYASGDSFPNVAHHFLERWGDDKRDNIGPS